MSERNRNIGEVFDDGEIVDRAVRRGRWFEHKREHAVPVRFCPFCGSAL